MRGKRSKQYRKLMHQYGLHFGFREPYQVLLDAEILQDASRFKMDFIGGLKKTLHGEIKLMITQCCIRHLYDAQPKDENLIEHAKAFERRRCNHQDLEKPLSAFECIASVLDPKDNGTNKHRYIVATQDSRLRSYLRQIPGVPLIYLKRSVMIMEPMAGSTERLTHKEELLKFKSGLKSRKGERASATQNHMPGEMHKTSAVGELDMRKNQSTGQVLVLDTVQKKRKRGPSGPNPLSVKKAKTKSISTILTKDQDGSSKPKDEVTAPSVSMDEDSIKKKRYRKHKPSNLINSSVDPEFSIAESGPD